MMKTRLLVIAATSSVLALSAVALPAEAASAKHYSNCTALHKAYKHGVGKPGAKDKSSSRRVTTFKKSSALYAANKGLDRDKDGIACEQR